MVVISLYEVFVKGEINRGASLEDAILSREGCFHEDAGLTCLATVSPNRLLNFHVVRSTRPVVFTPAAFVPTARTHSRRDVEHMEQNPNYPDPAFFLGRIQESFLLCFETQSRQHLFDSPSPLYLWVSL